MLDPGALGTLRIGLDALRAEAERDGRGSPLPPPRPDRPGIRVSLARALRHAAELLDRPAVRGAGDQPC